MVKLINIIVFQDKANYGKTFEYIWFNHKNYTMAPSLYSFFSNLTLKPLP